MLRRRSAASNRPQTPEDFRKLLGRKLSLRYALHEAGYSSTEAIGVLMSVSPGDRDGEDHIELIDRLGRVRNVPIRDIEAAKVFPR